MELEQVALEQEQVQVLVALELAQELEQVAQELEQVALELEQVALELEQVALELGQVVLELGQVVLLQVKMFLDILTWWIHWIHIQVHTNKITD